jgi:hypothetical protein
MFKDFGNFLFESTDSEERQKEKDQAEKLKKAKAAAADAKSKLDSTENDKEASPEDRAKAKLIYIKNTAIVTQLESDAKLKGLEDSVKEDVNEGVLVIAAGVILGLMGLKLLKAITKKVLGTIGMNVKIEPDKLKSILSKIVKETMFEAGGMLGSDFIQIAIIERQIASKIDNGEITTIGGIMAEFESLTKD